jgi:adenosylcobinamide kinase/adenosylcobinamide-phosphate guanylyltransferase
LVVGLVSLPKTIATPRATSRITAFSTAGLLALGSSLSATFPVSQWYFGLQLTDYSCGGSRGFEDRIDPLPHSRFNPLAGNRRPIDNGKVQPPSIEFAVMSTTPLPPLTFVLGGARSGKSRYAEKLVMDGRPPWVYVATAQAHDDEMSARIATHQARRDGKWRTVEAPLDLPAAITALSHEEHPVLIDCLTLWLSNIMLAGQDWKSELRRLVAALSHVKGPVVIVSNEVGLGIVPDNPLAREFRDAQGRLNMAIAEIADRAVLIAAGLPLILK